MGKEIFVSYTQADKQVAYDIVDYLEQQGKTCFVAPRDITPGMSYANCLVEAMHNCETAILVFSEVTNQSEHVLNEVEILFDKRKKIIPFLLEDVTFNDDMKYYLSRKQHVIAYDGEYQESFPEILDAMGVIATNPWETDKGKIEKNKKTIFEFIPERGIMVNPADHQRNVSFRSDTLVELFSEIYRAVSEVTDEATAAKIFFQSGYNAGENFGTRLNEMWSEKDYEIELKLKKWCEFDSAVGWGKFDIEMKVDEEEGTLEGELTIAENFMANKKKKWQICEFIKGYCSAVIKSLCRDVDVKLECETCPMKNKFKNECKFRISVLECEE